MISKLHSFVNHCMQYKVCEESNDSSQSHIGMGRNVLWGFFPTDQRKLTMVSEIVLINTGGCGFCSADGGLNVRTRSAPGNYFSCSTISLLAKL